MSQIPDDIMFTMKQRAAERHLPKHFSPYTILEKCVLQDLVKNKFTVGVVAKM